MSNWLCILDRACFEEVKTNLIWGLAERHKNNLLRARPKDLCAFYLISERSGKLKKESAIVGIFEVISNPYQDKSIIFISKYSSGEIYPYRVRLKPIKIFEPEIPFKSFISIMSFITNKKNYGGHLMGKAMREIPQKDMELIQGSSSNIKIVEGLTIKAN